METKEANLKNGNIEDVGKKKIFKIPTQVEKMLKPLDLEGKNSHLGLSASQIRFLRGRMAPERTIFEGKVDSDEDSDEEELPDLIKQNNNWDSDSDDESVEEDASSSDPRWQEIASCCKCMAQSTCKTKVCVCKQ